jgi:lactoylglutathione lyase
MKLNLAEFTERFGIILFVEKFYECEKFYAETIGLRISYRKESLTAFEFGNGYLMLAESTFHVSPVPVPPITSHFSPLTLLLHRTKCQPAHQLFLRKPSHYHNGTNGQ